MQNITTSSKDVIEIKEYLSDLKQSILWELIKLDFDYIIVGQLLDKYSSLINKIALAS